MGWRSRILLPLILIFFASCSKFLEPLHDVGGSCEVSDDCKKGLVCLNNKCANPNDEVDIFEAAEIDESAIEDEFADIEEISFDEGVSVEEFEEQIKDESEAELFVEYEEEEEIAGPGWLGWPCDNDSDCMSNRCVEGFTSQKICTIPCDDSCPYGYTCKALYKDAGGEQFFCLPNKGGLCLSCKAANECPVKGSLCLSMEGGSFCTIPCATDYNCPDGYKCEEMSSITSELPEIPMYQCLPALKTCACTEATLGKDFVCSISNEYGKCVGTSPCDSGGAWGKCNAKIPGEEVCDNIDNNCDTFTDEPYKIIDWDGVEKGVGENCGTGVCSNGIVYCVTPMSADCSTQKMALQKELCGDKKDNNCNGKTDEECYSDDLDGDGYKNEEDCNPYRSETYPGAAEPCCSSSVPSEQTIEKCDLNCDGKIFYCPLNDGDDDGYQSGEDCNDADPNVHPNAPEKCGNGIDEDCDNSDLSCPSIMDNDNDGFAPPDDCNDNASEINPWAKEKCNYIDDDCDGVIDDGNPEGDSECGSGEGECEKGIVVCAHYPYGAKLECIGSKEPSDEICDGLDNNCNGKTDEGFPVGESCDGNDSDKCEHGKWSCKADGSGVECVNETVSDILEVCDNMDNDCDGDIDEICYPDDIDGDGYKAIEDCNNLLPEFHPGAKEPCCDPSILGEAALDECDYNCDGKVTYCQMADNDFDGFSKPEDCNDGDPSINKEAPEKCGDGIDQDCDNIDLPCETVVDKDKDGYSPPDDCNDNNKDIHPWAAETCNYIDDDCDGVIDEGNPEGGLECGEEIGECKPGFTVCMHEKLKAVLRCYIENKPVKEKCDGKDNDCDGKTDEDFTVGEACDGGDTDFCKNGTLTCKPDESGTECVNEVITNIVELCDKIDNDCDGFTDEGYKYEEKLVGETCDGIGECGMGIVVCSADKITATCSTNPDGTAPQAIPELCDKKDNDCDGIIDNNIFYFGLPVGAVCDGIGECGLGIVECSPSGKPTCSSNPDGSSPQGSTEKCDGKDNDCDGHFDEGLTVFDSNCKLLGVCLPQLVAAKCSYGKWKCDYSKIGTYDGEFELSCDGLDNDCDGNTDEEFPLGMACDGEDSDQCKNGTWTCKGDYSGVECVNETVTDIKELCDDFDNDCNGETDEIFPVGEFCDGEDSDNCMNGSWTCKKDKSGVECVNETIKDIKELCDGIDNDCDGVTDEDFPVNQLCDGDDPDNCKTGTYICSENKLSVVCINDVGTGTDEICDGEDNDCDGYTDEGFFYNQLPVGEPCDGIGECGIGTVVCLPTHGAATCSTNPDGTTPQDKPEKCDFLDNDCDGLTDEGLKYEGIPLGGGCDGIGECGIGTVVCSPLNKTATCSTNPDGTEPQNIQEFCDGKDNDCDGDTDEGITPDKSGCLKLGVCKEELIQAYCVNGNWICDYQYVPDFEMGVEISCDGKDNNCDGNSDESFPEKNLPCDGGDSDQCKNGTLTCKADKSGLECVNETIMNIIETCDGNDNDCNGITDDEGASGCSYYYRDFDGDSWGVTGEMKCLCYPGQIIYYSAIQWGDCKDDEPAVNPGMVEYCNGIDDNCKNGADENFPDKGKQCDSDDPDLCKNGTYVCSEDGMMLLCLNDINQPEICDSIDNDCDGSTDEGFQIGLACDGDDIDKCKNGTWTCKADHSGSECVNETIVNITEKCDKKDNDCDGLTDEDFPVNQPCDGDDSDKCKYGTYTCTADGSNVECINETIKNIAEQCDNIDNDCDLSTDEDWPDKGKKCDGSDGDTCPTGVYLCTADKLNLYCYNDIECAYSASCVSSGSDYLTDECMCGDYPCNTQYGNICTPLMECKCGSNPACSPPTTNCVNGSCQ